MDIYTKKVELLAPGGSFGGSVLALESGADAVYVGLKRFSARARAENLSLEELSRLVNHARATGKKVYVAFNTLVKESEILEAASILFDVAEIGPDAAIVQDLGVVRILREFLPELPIHASTQMGIHNSAGMKAAEALGIKRVILERQLTFQEIASIARKTDLELEIFAHGALCCSLSGVCLISSWLGGRSGNRGRCAQPCRRRFHGPSGNGFFFSMKDMATIKDIRAYRDMGIASFKIEGRLKDPAHIANVVSAYRSVLDAEDKEVEGAMAEARNALSRVGARRFMPGFRSKTEFKNVIDPAKPGGHGIPVGKVVSSSEKGFTLSLSRKIHSGDVLRFRHGDEETVFAIGLVIVDGEKRRKAQKGEKCFIPREGGAPRGAIAHKIGETTPEPPAPPHSARRRARRKVDLTIRLSAEGIKVSADGVGEWTSELSLAVAEKNPVSPDTLKNAFSTSNAERVQAGTIAVEYISGRLFMPASVLKAARRSFWEWCDLKYAETAKSRKTSFLERLGKAVANRDEGDASGASRSGDKPFEPPFFIPESELEKAIGQIADLPEGTLVALNSTHVPALLIEAGFEGDVAATFPLPVCNSMAAREIRGLLEKTALNAGKRPSRLVSVEAWVELEGSAIERLAERSPVQVETPPRRELPLLATRAEIPVEGKITDDRGGEYRIEKDRKTGLTLLLPKKEMDIPEAAGTFKRRADSADETNASRFNYDRELI